MTSFTLHLLLYEHHIMAHEQFIQDAAYLPLHASCL